MSRFHEELYRQKGPKHDDLVIKCVSDAGIKKIVSACDPANVTRGCVIDYETEVLCESHGYHSKFILGYADLVIFARAPDARETDIQYIRPILKILVEVKPQLTDIGSTVRQLKTYESVIGGCEKAIVTCSKIDKDVLDYLKHERITVVCFPGGP